MSENYQVQPYINPDRDLATEDYKPVPKKNMEILDNGLLAGDIILLWRIQFGTFTNETWYPKYFEYIYGINAPLHLEKLIEEGYCYVESPFASLDHINANKKKQILKDNGVPGISKMKAADLDRAILQHIDENSLGSYFDVRGIALTEKGTKAIEDNPQVIDRHPKKNL